MDITRLRFNLSKLLGDVFVVACAFVAYAIAGGSVLQFGHLLIGLVVLLVVVAIVCFVVWGIVQNEHVWASIVAAIVLIGVTVIITLFARGVFLWWFHQVSVRAFVGMVVFLIGFAVTVWSYKSRRSAHAPVPTASPAAPAGSTTPTW